MPSNAIHNIDKLPSTEKVITFLHAVWGFPTEATFIKAINKNNLTTFPGLIAAAITNFFPESDETQKGHMRQQWQNIRSTNVPDEDELLTFMPTPGVKHKDVYLWVFNTTKQILYTHQTGCFSVASSHGNKYIMVAVELDRNYIDAEPLQS